MPGAPRLVLSAREVRLLLLAAVVALPVAVLGVRAAITPLTTDFFCFWTGSSFLLSGRDPYDQLEWARATSAVGVDAFGRIRDANCPGRFGYPLTTAVTMVPLAVLSLGHAAAVWELGIFVATVIGTALLARAAAVVRWLGIVLVVVVVISQPFEQTVLSAQFGGVSLLAIGLLAAPRVKTSLGSFALLLVAVKPHAVPLVPLVLLRTDRRRLAVVAMPLLLLAVVSLALRPGWLASWIAELGGHRVAMFAEAVSLWTLANVAGQPLLGPVLIAAGMLPLLPILIAGRAHDRHMLDVIAALALSWLLLSPYGRSDDQLAPLAVAWAAILRRAVIPQTSGWIVFALFSVAGVLPWMLYLVRFDVLAYGGLEVLNALVPPVTAWVLGLVVMRQDRPRVAPGAYPNNIGE